MLVLDTLSNFDGLERLIVIAVGLDAKLDEDVLETRSRLYRALTRAHMLALVVNENVRGGWLEWLNRVKLDRQAAFDLHAERARQNADAAQSVVRKRLQEIQQALQVVLGKAKEDGREVTSEESREIQRRIESTVKAEETQLGRERGDSLSGQLAERAAEQCETFWQQKDALEKAAVEQKVELSAEQTLTLQKRMDAQQRSAREGTAVLVAAAQAVVDEWVREQKELLERRQACLRRWRR